MEEKILLVLQAKKLKVNTIKQLICQNKNLPKPFLKILVKPNFSLLVTF